MHHLDGANLGSDMKDHEVRRRMDGTLHRSPRGVELVYIREVQKLDQWLRETLCGKPSPKIKPLAHLMGRMAD